MCQQEKMEKELLTEIDGYFMHLTYLKDLINVEDHMAKSSLINEHAPNFNLIVQCALYDSYVMCLMKFYDKSKEAKTIPNLIEKCKKNKHLFPDPDEAYKKLLEFEEKINNDEIIAQVIRTLKFRRNKYYAHNDKKYFGVKIANDESYLPKNCIWHLRDFTEEVLSYLWSQLSDEKPRETKYNNDLDKLLFKKNRE